MEFIGSIDLINIMQNGKLQNRQFIFTIQVGVFTVYRNAQMEKIKFGKRYIIAGALLIGVWANNPSFILTENVFKGELLSVRFGSIERQTPISSNNISFNCSLFYPKINVFYLRYVHI